MQRAYEPRSAELRAQGHRKNARELERAGYHHLAEYHREMAAWLSPPPPKVIPTAEVIDNRHYLRDGGESYEMGAS